MIEQYEDEQRRQQAMLTKAVADGARLYWPHSTTGDADIDPASGRVRRAHDRHRLAAS